MDTGKLTNEDVPYNYTPLVSEPEPNYIKVPYTSHVQSYVPDPVAPAPAPAPVQPQSKKPSVMIGAMLAGTLALGAVLGGAGAEAVMLANNSAHTASASTASVSTSSGLTTTTGTGTIAQSNTITIGSVYAKVSPSVVQITAVISSGSGRFSTSGAATGTGIILDTKGNILTNYHVIQGATSIKIELSDGSQYEATVVGTAPQDDLAVIKTTAPSNLLTPATLGSSSSVAVGDEVIAIGYPYGLDQSVTSGIVSGLDRTGSGSSTSRTLSGLIQVDAAINPGNSGGPLLNSDGEVVGVNTMIESPVEGFTGVGLAIPIDHVKALLTQLEGGGQVSRPWIGIAGVDISSELQTLYSLPVSSGILVMEVTAGSPAANAGLVASVIADPTAQSGTGTTGTATTTKIGDIITAIDGQKATAVSDLTSYLNGKQPGDKVTLTIMRDGKQQQVSITLQAWPAADASN